MTIFSNNPYYHKTIESLITNFGAFFSGIQVRKNNPNGSKTTQISVPIAYGPGSKWMERIRAQPNPSTGQNIQITVPRLAFEITDYRYDSARKIGTLGNYTKMTLENGQAVKVFNPVPYDISIQLMSITNDQDTSFQILEQILPYFAPTMSLLVKSVPELNIIKQVPLTLNNVSNNDTYDSSPDEFRFVTQTFNFLAKVDMFGPIMKPTGDIKNTLVDVGNSANNQGMVQQDQVINPFDADEVDPHEVVETWSPLPK
jgi:hypothetical protein